MNRNTNALAVAIAASLGASAAHGAVKTVTLVTYATYSNNGSSAGNITSSTATWQFDDVTGIVTQTGGTLNARFTTAPTSTLFRHTTTGLSFGGGGAASATTFSCLEGNFGGGVGASICGNYNFGANFANDSTLTYSGSSVTRTLGGDDGSIGSAQSVADLNGIAVVANTGTQVTLTNGVCTLSPAANCTTITGAPLYNKGYNVVFQLPTPVAVDDTASTHLNTATVIDILGNDTNLDDPVEVSITTPPDNGGSVVITDDGATASNPCADPCTANAANIRVTLTPSAIPNSPTYTENFGYTVTGNSQAAQTASVAVTVQNAVPVANDAGLTVPASGGPVTIDVATIAGNVTGDAVVSVVASDGTLGTTTESGTSVTYTLTGAQAADTDTFTYTITDGDGESDTGTITVTINAPSTPFSSTGLREDDGGSALDWATLALFGGAALARRRRRSA